MRHLISNFLSLAAFLAIGSLVASSQISVFDITDLTTFPIWNGMVYIYILFWPLVVLWLIAKTVWFFFVGIWVWVVGFILVVGTAIVMIEKIPALEPVSRWLASKL